MKRFIKKYSRGYLLPAVIFLGLAISAVSGTFLLFISQSSETLNQQNYATIAEEAAHSGIAYADSCLQLASTWEGRDLRPNTTCNGTVRAVGTGSMYVTQHGGEWRSTFRVTQNTTDELIISTGVVEILDAGGQVVSTVQKELRMNLDEGYETAPTSTGRSITAIKSDDSSCAIANGGLYCWGDNGSGKLGIGSGASSRNTPQAVLGDMAGKTVTKVSVSNSNVCAIADGKPFCWGGNGNDQLGNDIDGDSGAKNSVRLPTNNVPRVTSGPLQDLTSPLLPVYTTDIGTASANNPAGPVWPFATSAPHSCALTANGAVSCWGYGGFRQLTGGGCVFLVITLRCAYPSHAYPTLVKGYDDNTGPFKGKKAIRVGASSHDSCLVAEGLMYCWGVEAPLMPEGFGRTMSIERLVRMAIQNFWGIAKLSCTLPLGMFSDPMITLWPYNPCVVTYSNGYNAINSNASSARGTLLDPATWDVSSNEGCWMGHRNFYCFGTTPAYATFWLSAFRAPWTVLSNTDVTDSDNGDSNEILTGGFTGLYCIVEKGKGRCAGSPANANTGRGHLAGVYDGFKNLSTATGLDGQVATKIAAGHNFGCVVANGRLYCWGDGSSGKRASGDSSFSWTPVHTGASDGSTLSRTIGTGLGQYAAHDSVSAGESHSCGIANGKVFCWGSNTDGQLGMGNYSDVIQPRAVPQFVTNAATKVSAGKNHTCAIVEGQLWCWGGNLKGQLGISSVMGSTPGPRLVNGNGALTTAMRVTDVSVGDTNTCVVANAKVYCWGENGNRQVGDSVNTSTIRNVPTLVNGNSNILGNKAATAVSVGPTHACAVVNADLYCWGNNANGRTGLGTTSGNAVPTQVVTGTADQPRGPNNMRPAVSGVTAGSDFTCAIFNGMVSCWGNNANGRTGRSTTAGNTMAPAALTGTAGLYYATTITAGRNHACALLHGNNSKANGNMYCWGNNTDGQLGYGTLAERTSVTIPITGGSDMSEGGELRSATAVSAGASTTCAIANAVILCWGNGPSDYQLGTGGYGIASSAVPVKTDGYQVTRSGYAKGPVY